jgi:hypothetical protein
VNIHDENDPDHLGSQSLKDIVAELASARKARHYEETIQRSHDIARFCYGFIPAFVLILVFGGLARAAADCLTQLLLHVG